MLGDDVGENHDGEPPLGDDVGENHDGEPPLGDDVGENHDGEPHDGEPPQVGLILLSSSRRRRKGCRDGCELAERIFFGPTLSEFGGFYKKSTCTVT